MPMSVQWLEGVMGIISKQMGPGWKGLFVTPSASGKLKPDLFVVKQGTKVRPPIFPNLSFYVFVLGLWRYADGGWCRR